MHQKKHPRRLLRVKESKTKPTPVKPRPEKIASGKKLALSLSTSITTPSSVAEVLATSSSKAEGLSGCELHGYHLIKLSDLASVLREVEKCSTCSCPLSLHKNLGCWRGLVSRVVIMCNNPACLQQERVHVQPLQRISKISQYPFCAGDAPGWPREIWAGDLLLSDGHASSCIIPKLLHTHPTVA